MDKKSNVDFLEDKYRHEIKYQINTYHQAILTHSLPAIMMLDSHIGQQGKYKIRSLYFDDLYNSCYYESKNGTNPREKFRIRIYNGSLEQIRLELKRTEAERTLKKSCPLTKEQTERLIRGEYLEWDEDMSPLLKKLYILEHTKMMKPKVIVEYDRIPYDYKVDNVRVTLDLDIKTSTDVSKFLDKSINAIPIMPTGTNMLKVKYDTFFPNTIFNTMQMEDLSQITFSKYYLCRKFGGLL